MQFDTKIVVVLRDDLAGWQAINAAAFLVSGIAATVRDVVGGPYRDGSGNEYLPMFVQPVLVYEAGRPGLRRAYERALARDVTPRDLHAGAVRHGARRREPGCSRLGRGGRARARGHRLSHRAQDRRQDR